MRVLASQGDGVGFPNWKGGGDKFPLPTLRGEVLLGGCPVLVPLSEFADQVIRTLRTTGEERGGGEARPRLYLSLENLGTLERTRRRDLLGPVRSLMELGISVQEFSFVPDRLCVCCGNRASKSIRVRLYAPTALS